MQASPESSPLPVKATAVYTLFGLAPLLSSFLLLPINTSYLSAAEFGIVTLATITRTYLFLFVSLGLDHATARFYFDENESPARLRHLLSVVLTGIAVSATIVAIVLLVVGDTVFDFTWRGNLSFEVYGWYVAATAVADAFNAVFLQFYRASRDLRRYVVLALLALVSSTLGGLIGMVALELGALGNIAGKCLGLLAVSFPYLVWILWRTGVAIDKTMLSSLYRYSVPIVIYAIFGNTSAMIDRIVLNSKLGLAELGVYNLAFTATSLIGIFLYGFWNAATPEIYRVYEREHGRKDVEGYCLGTFLLVFSVTWCLIAVADPILRAMSTASYHGATQLVPVLAIAYVFRSLYVIYTMNVFYHKNTAILPTITLATLVLTTGVMLLLADRFGVAGVSVSVVIVQFTFFGIAYGLDWKRHRREQSYLFPLGRVVPLVLASLVVLLLNEFVLYDVTAPPYIHFAEGILMIGAVLIFYRERFGLVLDAVQRSRRTARISP